MIQEILDTIGLAPYRATAIELMRENRFFTRACILEYWKHRGYISTEEWFARTTHEIWQNYRREKDKGQ